MIVTRGLGFGFGQPVLFGMGMKGSAEAGVFIPFLIFSSEITEGTPIGILIDGVTQLIASPTGIRMSSTRVPYSETGVGPSISDTIAVSHK